MNQTVEKASVSEGWLETTGDMDGYKNNVRVLYKTRQNEHTAFKTDS